MPDQKQLAATSVKTAAQGTVSVLPKFNYKPLLGDILEGRICRLPEKLRVAVEGLNREAKARGKEGEIRAALKDLGDIENNYLLNHINRITQELKSGTLKNGEDIQIGRHLMRESPQGADSVFSTIGNSIRILGEERWNTMAVPQKKAFVRGSMRLSKNQCPKEIQTTMASELEKGTFDDIPQAKEARLEIEAQNTGTQIVAQITPLQMSAAAPAVAPVVQNEPALAPTDSFNDSCFWLSSRNEMKNQHYPSREVLSNPPLCKSKLEDDRGFYLFGQLMPTPAPQQGIYQMNNERTRFSAMAMTNCETQQMGNRKQSHSTAQAEGTKILEMKTRTQRSLGVVSVPGTKESTKKELDLKEKPTIVRASKNKRQGEPIEVQTQDFVVKNAWKKEVKTSTKFEVKQVRKKKTLSLYKNERSRRLAKKKQEQVRKRERKKKEEAHEKKETRVKVRSKANEKTKKMLEKCAHLGEKKVRAKEKAKALKEKRKEKLRAKEKRLDRRTRSLQFQKKPNAAKAKARSTKPEIKAKKVSKPQVVIKSESKSKAKNDRTQKVRVPVRKRPPLDAVRQRRRKLARWLLLKDFLFPKRQRRVTPIRTAVL
jgi:hypothetical protein